MLLPAQAQRIGLRVIKVTWEHSKPPDRLTDCTKFCCLKEGTVKNLLSRLVAIAVICITASVLAFASSKNDSVTFASDTVVNGTSIKAGTYVAKFDQKTSELSIVKEGKVLAKVQGHLEKQDRKASSTQVFTTQKDNSTVFTGMMFAGESQAVVVGDSAAGK
jgi:hypothetical protein